MFDLVSTLVDVAFLTVGDLSHDGVVVRQNEVSYNPVTDVRVTEEVLYAFKAVQNSNTEEGKANTETPTYDLDLWAKFEDLSFEPLLNDTVRVGKEIFYVKDVKPIKPGNEALLYNLGLMK
ncbi:MAG: hypothetical protein RSC68_19045 [Acinetobacter sp.]